MEDSAEVLVDRLFRDALGSLELFTVYLGPGVHDLYVFIDVYSRYVPANSAPNQDG